MYSVADHALLMRLSVTFVHLVQDLEVEGWEYEAHQLDASYLPADQVEDLEIAEEVVVPCPAALERLVVRMAKAAGIDHSAVVDMAAEERRTRGPFDLGEEAVRMRHTIVEGQRLDCARRYGLAQRPASEQRLG